MTQQQTPNKPDDVLDLDDLAPERQQVKISDRLYDMIAPNELSFFDRAQLVRDSDDMMKLTGELEKSNSKVKSKKLEEIMRSIVDRVLPALPADELAKLDAYKLDLITGTFLARYGDMMKKVAAKLGATALPNGTPISQK